MLETRIPSAQTDEGPTLAVSLAELIAEAEVIQPGEPIRYTNQMKQAAIYRDSKMA
jgi:energy-converting hydrogenase Eha subunit G